MSCPAATCSPSATNQLETTPSAVGLSLDIWGKGTSVTGAPRHRAAGATVTPRHPVQCRLDAVVPRQDRVLQRMRIGHRHIGVGHPHHWRPQHGEVDLGDGRGDLARETEGLVVLVHDDEPPGHGDRLQDGLPVQRDQRAQVDDLDVDRAGELLGASRAWCTDRERVTTVTSEPSRAT